VIQLIINGAVLGAIYSLAAIGFVLIHNVSGSVNFSHGALVLLGAYFGITFEEWFPSQMWLAVVLAMLAMALVGVVLERVAFRPLEGKPFVAVFISTLALGIAIGQAILLIWGPQPQSGQPLAQGNLTVGSITVPVQGVVILAVTVVAFTVQWLLIHRTVIGIRVRATADNAAVAGATGIRTTATKIAVFAVAAALAGLAGVLIAPLSFVDPSLGGIDFMVKIYIAVIIGGFGSEIGAMVGGIALGIVEVLTAAYISSAYSDAIIFGALILLLVTRPNGLMGRHVTREA
jgi:branched-chain amino acid transport system permease protein